MGYFTSPTYKWGFCWGYNPLILTFDPNFQRDIQVFRVRPRARNTPQTTGKLNTYIASDSRQKPNLIAFLFTFHVGHVCNHLRLRKLTHPLKNGWLEDYFPLKNGPFSGDMLVFRGKGSRELTHHTKKVT